MCESADIGVKKGVKVAFCDMGCIDLTENVMKILGIYFPYNKNLGQEKSLLRNIVKIENILKL